MRLWTTVAATALVALAAVFGMFVSQGESCFERLERVHVAGEQNPGELDEVEKSC